MVNKIYFGTDHAGFDMKEQLLTFVRDELGYSVEDCGAYELDKQDDYPEFMHKVADKVVRAPEARGIILGGSGQGEAMVANRHNGVRATAYYAHDLDIIKLSREHNDANILSLGARFLTLEQAKEAVELWLKSEFSRDERHVRRIKEINNQDEFDNWNNIKKQTNAIDSTWYFKNGDIYFMRLGKNIGFEQDGKGEDFLRPVLVLKKYNRYVFTGVPLTTNGRDNKYYYDIGSIGDKNNFAILSQVRLLDARRIEYKIGHVAKDIVASVKNKISEILL